MWFIKVLYSLPEVLKLSSAKLRLKSVVFTCRISKCIKFDDLASIIWFILALSWLQNTFNVWLVSFIKFVWSFKTFFSQSQA